MRQKGEEARPNLQDWEEGRSKNEIPPWPFKTLIIQVNLKPPLRAITHLPAAGEYNDFPELSLSCSWQINIVTSWRHLRIHIYSFQFVTLFQILRVRTLFQDLLHFVSPTMM